MSPIWTKLKCLLTTGGPSNTTAEVFESFLPRGFKRVPINFHFSNKMRSTGPCLLLS
uniref:Uncharacterized protein n=1 Tax=Anguilla anguilla TaxID=7936 RepID=A0A0E9V9Z8_ANGAN